MTEIHIPQQPDGIEDDSHDLPHPARAAERVREYISAFGDGLYDVLDGAALYGRDLEAISRTALGSVTLWRCTKCGKWSHAKRRPKQHQRFIRTGTKTVEYQEAETGAWVGEEVPDGDFQPCGPFAEWVAAPTTGPLPPPPHTVPSRPHRDEPRFDRPVTTVHLPA